MVLQKFSLKKKFKLLLGACALSTESFSEQGAQYVCCLNMQVDFLSETPQVIITRENFVVAHERSRIV